MTEPIWVTCDVVLAIHQRQMAEHGGDPGIRDQALLESALDRPKNRYAYAPEESDLATLAASYAFGLSRNHPFVDGNKRVSLVVCRTFLMLNGGLLEATQEEKYETFVQLAQGDLSESQLADWIRRHLPSPPTPGTREA